MSTEIDLMIDPNRAYAALGATARPVGLIRALRRPLLVAVVLGTSMALSTTRHVTPTLVVSTTMVLSVFVLGQLLIALTATSGFASPAIGRARALDLFFASHAPWSLWMLASAVWVPSPLGHRASPLFIAALVPMVLTPRILAAYFREIQGLDRRAAAVRTIVHQMLTWGLFVAAFGAAVAIWPRILQALS
jgi:hypothetical protein